MEQFDPYAELGVEREADEAAIKRAYRKRAKETHPDAGGDADAFRRVELAYAVLSDKARRGRYDKTGVLTDDEPDALRRAALQVIEGHLCFELNSYVQSRFNPMHDPRVRRVDGSDLIARIVAKITGEIAEANNNSANGEMALAFFRDMADRFGSKNDDNFLRRHMEFQQRGCEQSIAMVKEAIPPRELALELLKGCKFNSADVHVHSASSVAGHIVIGSFRIG